MTVTSRWRKAAEITAYKQQLNAFIMNIWYPANRGLIQISAESNQNVENMTKNVTK